MQVPSTARRWALCATLPLLASCTTGRQFTCPPDAQQLAGCPPASAVDDERINQIHDTRSWRTQGEIPVDSVSFSDAAKVPINHARAKVIGPSHDKAITSLAAKIWLIEHAQHTIDATYYIFTPDIVGYSLLGAMCDAVKRGVDIRLMVDSIGSFSFKHDELKALGSCAAQAGFMRNAQGQVTTRRARVQVVVFNAASKFHFNRRSHDKFMVVDGQFPELAAVFTGGRNSSRDYYGLKEDGSEDTSAFRDLEILVRSPLDGAAETVSVGKVADIYYTVLFQYKGNKLIWSAGDGLDHRSGYEKQRTQAAERLAFVKSLPEFRIQMDDMDRFMREDFHDAQVRLAFQLNNLTNRHVSTEVLENLKENPNSIDFLLHKMLSETAAKENLHGTLRIVSPYLFASKYHDKDGKLVFDAAQQLLDTLSRNPGLNVEIFTNSVMTTDNPYAQAMIDMDMAPRLLLSSQLQQQWTSSVDQGERNPAVVQGDEWRRLVQNPQVAIYEMGMLDSQLLGNGKVDYGKLHAKFIIGETVGFVGTSNFDYRSMLYNNEVGFFVSDPGLLHDMVAEFDWLKAKAYRWGSPEWLEMRKQIMDGKGPQADLANKQRKLYKTMQGLGTEYLM
jgi:cardiolipin synthase C